MNKIEVGLCIALALIWTAIIWVWCSPKPQPVIELREYERFLP